MIHPLTRGVMVEPGYDVAGPRAKGVKEFSAARRSARHHACGPRPRGGAPSFPFATRDLRWPFDDPVQVSGTEAERLAVFRGVRDAIEARLRTWLEALAQQ